MTDPLSTPAGIAGLIGLTIEVFGLSYKYVCGVCNASLSAHLFVKELEDLQTVLYRVKQMAKDTDQSEVFGGAGSCLLSIEQSDEYLDLLQEVRDRLQQREKNSSFKNVLKALTWPFSKEETDAHINSLHRYLKIYNTALAADNRTVGELTLSEVKKINVSQEDSRIKEILNWLSTLNMYQKHEDTLSKRSGDTGSWLLEDSTFRNWVELEFSCYRLWCPGDPGTGKTVITSVVIQHLLENYASEEIKVAYIYCDYKDQAVQTPSNLVACLARQIIGYAKQLPQGLLALHERCELEKRRPRFDELKNLLEALLNHYKRTYIIVDALDECKKSYRDRLLPVLESLPCELTKAFVTSRPHNEDIIKSFGTASQLTIVATESDLRQYLIEKIEKRENSRSAPKLKPELKEEIVSTVSNRASEMFLIAALQIDRILASRTIKKIRSTLTSMPDTIDELYQETLKRVHEQGGDDAKLGMRILSWITHAKRLLSVNELRYGLAVEYNDPEEGLNEIDAENLLSREDLVDVCAGLVIIDAKSKVIRLVHYTTQEYFDKNRWDLFGDVEIDISRACLTCLSDNMGIRFVERYDYPVQITFRRKLAALFKSNPFLHYASHCWFSHVRSTLLSKNIDPVLLKALTYFKRSDSIINWIHLLRLEAATSPIMMSTTKTNAFDRKSDMFPLMVASSLGLEDLVTVLLDDGTGTCPGLNVSLPAASGGGSPNLVRLLLERGAAIDSLIRIGVLGQVSALGVSCGSGNLAVVRLLIENGADVDVRSSAITPPICCAAISENPDIIDILLNEGANVNSRDRMGRTPCHLAAMHSDTNTVKRLLDARCDLELKDKHGDTVLFYAVDIYLDDDRATTFNLLLDSGANASAKNRKGKTARNLVEDSIAAWEQDHQRPFDQMNNRFHERAERVIENLRQAEQKASTSETNDPQESIPSSSAHTISPA